MRKVSIILLWWSRTPELEELSKKCLKSVLANTRYPEYEVIVIKNKCEEFNTDYLETFSHPKVKLAFNSENLGFVVGNNQGIKLAGRNDVLLLNNDTEVPKGWLTPIMETLDRYPDAGMAMPVQFHTGSAEWKEFDESVPRIIEHAEKIISKAEVLGHTYQKLIGGNWLPLCATLIKREVIDKAGYLDEKFLLGGHEDVDYSWRTLDAGFQLYVCGTSRVFHYYGKSFHFLGGYSEVWAETGKYLMEKHNAVQTVDNAVYRIKDKTKEWYLKSKDRIKPAELAKFKELYGE